MTLIFLNSKFPLTKKSYAKAGDDNTHKLKEVMSKLTLQESSEALKGGAFRGQAHFSLLKAPAQSTTIGGAGSWSYAERKKNKPKTFNLT